MSAGSAGGRVTLVGGGPGDPGLVTVAGLAALAEADVVLYDHLAPADSLRHCRTGALLIDVGKIPGGRSTSQERINALLLEHAAAGRHVVRFKGGDPFVFGRGGEEVQACAEAGVPVTLVPGVSSSVSGPGLAGIPLTHRGTVQAFTVVSGHVPPGHAGSTTDWAALARARHTIVVLMGVANLAAICAELHAHGLPATTPAAVISDASLPSMQVVRADLAGIAEAAASVRPPALVVIGGVAGLALPLANEPAPGSEDVLRPATADDAGELLVLQRACWLSEALDHDSLAIPALHETLADVIADLEAWQTWVLRRDGRLIGAVRGQLDDRTWDIGRLMVAPDCGGAGLGRMLLAHMEAQAPAEADRFRLITGERSLRNQRMYQRAGYDLVAHHPAGEWAAIVELVKPRG